MILRELRKEQGLTQEQLAQKCGASKTYISRIENNAGDIRLSTLMRIIRVGLGRQLTFSLDMLNDVKSLSGVINLPEDFDPKEEYKKYIVNKYSK